MTQRIINTWDQLKAAVRAGVIPEASAVAISYTSPDPRTCRVHCSTVWSPFFEVNPNGAWYNDGAKAFVGNRAESMPQAKAWASATFGITRWKGNRMRDLVPAEVQEQFPIPARAAEETT